MTARRDKRDDRLFGFFAKGFLTYFLIVCAGSILTFVALAWIVRHFVTKFW